MEVKQIEKLNQAKLKKRYHHLVADIPDQDIKNLLLSWKNGDKDLYMELFEKYRDTDQYYILFIWLSPLTKWQQLAKGLDNLDHRLEKQLRDRL